jgi:integrase
MTLNDAFARYFTEVSKGTPYGERTQRYNMRVLLLAVGRDTLLSDLTDQVVNGAVQWLRTRKPSRDGQPAAISTATINRYLTTLSVVCRRAKDLWGVDVGPWAKAKHIKPEAEGRETFLDYSQAEALMNAACGHLRPILLVALTTGLRLRNVTDLAWEQISLDMARAVLVQKGGRRHNVALPAPVLDMLRTLEPKAAKRAGPVFRFGNPNLPCNCSSCKIKVGQPILSIKRAFGTAAKNAKLDDLPHGRLRFHDLRHSFASYMLAEGGDLMQVKGALGHKVITTTARYTHLLPGRKEATVAAVAEKLTGGASRHEIGHTGASKRKKA